MGCLCAVAFTYISRRAWHPCGTRRRQRRTARRLGADHHRLRSAAPPDGRRRPAASRKRQNARPQMLNHRCVQQMFFIARWQCFSVVNTFSAKGWVSTLLFLRTAFEHFNDPPAFFFRTQIRFPWPVFCCQLLDPAIANVACTLAHMQLACKRTSQMPAHNP